MNPGPGEVTCLRPESGREEGDPDPGSEPEGGRRWSCSQGHSLGGVSVSQRRTECYHPEALGTPSGLERGLHSQHQSLTSLSSSPLEWGFALDVRLGVSPEGTP